MDLMKRERLKVYYERIRKSQDYDEGTRAFAEKRDPQFERR